MSFRRAARIDANQHEIVDAFRACAHCGVGMPFRPPRTHDAHKENIKKFCSRKCSDESKNGSTNPNYSDAGRRICHRCGEEYRSYDKSRKYCSHQCYISAKPKAKPKAKPCIKKERPPKKIVERKPRVLREKLFRKCLMCENTFRVFQSSKQKYCSYQCHLNSSGAVRAGKAAGTMTRKYGAKKDANHKEIISAFEKLGAHVLDMSILGSGVPDILVMCRGTPYMVDIKNPETAYGRRGLNQNQKEWAEGWKGGPVYMISTVEQVADMVNGNLDAIRRFPPERGHPVARSDDVVQVVKELEA